MNFITIANFIIYPLDKISDEFLLRRRIINDNNEEILSIDKKLKRGSDSRVEFGKFNIDSLITGGYILEVSIIDNAKNVNISRAARFYIISAIQNNLSSNIGQDDFLKSEYATYTEKDIDDLYDKSIYLRKDEDDVLYKKMNNLEEKRKFMYTFWKKLDNMPGTPQNEFKIAFLKRMAEANKQFKEAFREGWKTDRGRIFVLYGAPSEIEHNNFEGDTKSYDIWKYDGLQGGVKAIFVEKEGGTGVYTLVTSDIRGEFNNPDWQKEIKKFN